MIPNILPHKIGRIIRKPLAGPFNLTISVTGKCNSRCRTCNIWQKDAEDLNLDQWTDDILEQIRAIESGEEILEQTLAMSSGQLNNIGVVVVQTVGTLPSLLLHLLWIESKALAP